MGMVGINFKQSTGLVNLDSSSIMKKDLSCHVVHGCIDPTFPVSWRSAAATVRACFIEPENYPFYLILEYFGAE